MAKQSLKKVKLELIEELIEQKVQPHQIATIYDWYTPDGNPDDAKAKLCIEGKVKAPTHAKIAATKKASATQPPKKSNSKKVAERKKRDYGPCPICGGPRESGNPVPSSGKLAPDAIDTGDAEDRLCFKCRSTEGRIAEMHYKILLGNDAREINDWQELRDIMIELHGSGLTDDKYFEHLEGALLVKHVNTRYELMRMKTSEALEKLRSSQSNETYVVSKMIEDFQKEPHQVSVSLGASGVAEDNGQAKHSLGETQPAEVDEEPSVTIPPEFMSKPLTKNEIAKLHACRKISNPTVYLRRKKVKLVGPPNSKSWRVDMREFPAKQHDCLKP
ncbi:hypothetical protein [Bythopirellula polymerisocia]|uniref:Uncharacterized protein n=1 Tax=Bythopirellula polymerisocia TaxID=2528003 RepID=A0A5C6CRQ5_9BACT|nr:hypothetical protein [Bythopirellula polymerisocia]TWU27603.1 hypothetical protein Pla144_23800 [Bythopirellula polymerisocia]